MSDFFDVVSRQRASRAFADDAGGRRRRSRGCSPRRRSHRARRTSSRGSSSSCATRGREHAIGDLTKRAWEESGRAFSEPRLSPELLADVDRGATGGFAAAPVQIVVCADTERGLEATVASSIFPAVQNLLLAATALGLGSALTDDRDRLSRRAPGAARPARARPAGRGRPDRTPRSRARAAHAGIRSPPTPTASATAPVGDAPRGRRGRGTGRGARRARSRNRGTCAPGRSGRANRRR